MIEDSEVAAMILEALPDAQVEIVDKNGMSDHFLIRVVSPLFAPMGLMDRHRTVMSALQPAFNDGRLHAAEIKTEVP